MQKLYSFIKSTTNNNYKNLDEREIALLIKDENCEDYNYLKDNYKITVNLSVFKADPTILQIIDENGIYKKYVFFTLYIPITAVILNIAFPIISGNYWLFCGLIVLFLGLLSSSIAKVNRLSLYYKTILIILAIGGLYWKSYYWILMAFTGAYFMGSIIYGKLLMHKHISNVANSNELGFKFLYLTKSIFINKKK